MRKIFVLMLSLSLFIPQAFALKIGGIEMPDTLTVDSTSLVLNGAGLRKKFFVKVYAGGLYLKKKCSDPQKIIAADEPMAIRMHWTYDGVASKKIVAGWNHGFQTGTGGKIQAIQKEIAKFNSYFSQEAIKNDIYEVIYQPGKGIDVQINGKSKGFIPGLEFKKAVFGIWLGNNDELKSMKKGMLGN